MEIPKCDYRIPTDLEGIFVCRHREVNKPENIVSEKDCKDCKWYAIKDSSPRIIFDIPRLKKKSIGLALWNAGKALSQFVYSRGKTVTPGQYKQRLEICSSCPERKPDGDTCTVCTCNLLLKSSSPFFDCPLKKWPKLSTETEKPLRKLIIRVKGMSPGDILMLTAAIRDLHKAYPGEFLTDLRTTAAALWENNPYVTPLPDDPDCTQIWANYSLIDQSSDRPYHFIHGYVQDLERQLGVKIPVTAFKGDVHVSETEKGWINQVEQDFGYKGKFWIIIAGGKYDFTAKWWNPESYQKVVDHFKGRIQFVQCGESHKPLEEVVGKGGGLVGGHWHPPLKGVLNLVGKTNLRQFIRLMYHSSGVVCPVTMAMHLAEAVQGKDDLRHRPCVVLAGGREASHWEAYTHHQFIHTCGMLKCCDHGGCWKSRCQLLYDGDSKEDEDKRCENPVKVSSILSIPKCLHMIKAEDVIRRIEMYLEGAS